MSKRVESERGTKHSCGRMTGTGKRNQNSLAKSGSGEEQQERDRFPFLPL